jgi:hypothetical protein
MTVLPLPIHGGVQPDARDHNRYARVSAHPEAGRVTLSLWRDDRCVGTHQMTRADAARLIALLADALAD